jgi:transposase-like protein
METPEELQSEQIPQTESTRRKNGTPSRNYTAAQKAEVVLKVWSERQTPAQICRNLNITWTILSQWQERALEGMLQALEPRVNLEKGAALNPRLQAMLAKKQGAFTEEKLKKRLRKTVEKPLDGE